MLGPASMDPELVKMKLESNLRTIRNCYSSYRAHIYESIKDRVSVDSLRMFLLDSPALDCVEDEDERQYKLLSEVKTQLEEAKSVYDILTLLTNECASFLNYEVFYLIQDEFKVDTTKNLYPDHLKRYINIHKVPEFVAINPKLENFPGASEKLIFKFNIPKISEFGRVVDLKVAIAEILRLKPSALQLIAIDIKDGCVEVTFRIPSDVGGYIFRQLSPKEIDAIRGLPVVWLKYGHYELNFKKKYQSGDTQQDATEVSSLGILSQYYIACVRWHSLLLCRNCVDTKTKWLPHRLWDPGPTNVLTCNQ